jgi:hypothetical protein
MRLRVFLWIGIAGAAAAILLQAAMLVYGEMKLHVCPEPHWHVCNDGEFKERVANYLQCLETTTLQSIDTKMAFLARDPNVTLLDVIWAIGHVYMC